MGSLTTFRRTSAVVALALAVERSLLSAAEAPTAIRPTSKPTVVTSAPEGFGSPGRPSEPNPSGAEVTTVGFDVARSPSSPLAAADGTTTAPTARASATTVIVRLNVVREPIPPPPFHRLPVAVDVSWSQDTGNPAALPLDERAYARSPSAATFSRPARTPSERAARSARSSVETPVERHGDADERRVVLPRRE